jgi:hypothetical protein
MKRDTHIATAQRRCFTWKEVSPLVVYLKLRTVSITLTSKVLDVLDELDVAGGGGGSDLPPVGISPAKIEVDSAHMSASAIANRFMDVAPLRLRKCRDFYIKKNGA